MINFHLILSALLFSAVTIIIYQLFLWIQNKTQKIWLNPMLLTIGALIAIMLMFNIDYDHYQRSTQIISKLLEPAVVALGFPLYQHLQSIKSQWKKIVGLISVAVIFAVSISYLLTIAVVKDAAVAVSLSLKSITTPIGIALTNELHGNSAITAFAIVLAGLFGAIFGLSWLKLIGVTSASAQGLAIGTASHALGTATISKVSFQHAAYSSLGLIVSAIITAIIAPTLLTFIQLNI